ncbi:MAG TPA: transglycosylase domain-containing protein [Candidatus Sulfomarinibacteraceae bacterium]|nr:transglycosylase domain-containing protein [Candidatus Sulfomarinibacteraceae bacterium]
MQTSLARRQRHRRSGAARRGRGGGSASRAALAIPILLFGSFLALGGVVLIGAVSAYAHYSRDLPDPKKAFEDLGFDQPSIIYDRTGTVELARLGERKRELVAFDEIPPEMIDATTAVEDKDFWSNPGFDLGGFLSATLDTIAGRPRGGSTITQQLVRARLLPPEAFEGSIFERKAREIIQSIRLTQAFPGQEGKEGIITAYLNQNFYGNQSYGIQAAAKGYFAKELGDLTLAEVAILAAIPQSPTEFDLVKNAVGECTVEIADGEECPRSKVRLVVPASSAIVVRRNKVLELMETRSVLSGASHTLAEYEAAKTEDVVLAPQGSAPWKAAHFVWQVRSQLGAILCGEDNADTCEKVDTGGYRIVTTLDWRMQQIVDKWLLAAARSPNLSNPERSLEALKIPESEWPWLLKLKDRNINNAAAAVVDYRTGEVLAYAGSAGYYAIGEATFKPQYDVLEDGFRQPGSAIKPLNYITGIDDGTMTAATMFMDVTTDFGGQKPFTPTQADRLERGPVRLRSALQFSLNIPSIKAGLINGLDHLLQRMKDFGLRFPNGTIPVTSMSIGTLDTHAIDMTSAYGAIANGGVLMSREYILEVRNAAGEMIFPTETGTGLGKRVASAQAAYIITDILQGNTILNSNPYWAKWRIVQEDGKRRPAAYKTGTTSDNKDVHAYGYLAPPEDPAEPALVVGVWMGNSDATPNSGSLSLDSSAPLWSRILTEISLPMPVASFVKPDGLVTAEVDAFSGLLPGPYTVRTVKELFIEGTVPTRPDDLHVELDIDQATGLLWQDGCTGPMVKAGFLDFSAVEQRFPGWQQYTQDWAARAAQGPGTPGGPDEEPTRTSYFYNNSFAPYGATWGGTFAPVDVCAPILPPICAPGTSFDPFATPDPFATIDPFATLDPFATPAPTPCIPPTPEPTPTVGPGDSGSGPPGNGNGPPTALPEPTPKKN